MYDIFILYAVQDDRDNLVDLLEPQIFVRKPGQVPRLSASARLLHIPASKKDLREIFRRLSEEQAFSLRSRLLDLAERSIGELVLGGRAEGRQISCLPRLLTIINGLNAYCRSSFPDAVSSKERALLVAEDRLRTNRESGESRGNLANWLLAIGVGLLLASIFDALIKSTGMDKQVQSEQRLLMAEHQELQGSAREDLLYHAGRTNFEGIVLRDSLGYATLILSLLLLLTWGVLRSWTYLGVKKQNRRQAKEVTSQKLELVIEKHRCTEQREAETQLQKLRFSLADWESGHGCLLLASSGREYAERLAGNSASDTSSEDTNSELQIL